MYHVIKSLVLKNKNVKPKAKKTAKCSTVWNGCQSFTTNCYRIQKVCNCLKIAIRKRGPSPVVGAIHLAALVSFVVHHLTIEHFRR